MVTGKWSANPSRKQLEDFVRRRNESEFHTNLQVQIDADCAGIAAECLRFERTNAETDGPPVYRCVLEHGTLFEDQGAPLGSQWRLA